MARDRGAKHRRVAIHPEQRARHAREETHVLGWVVPRIEQVFATGRLHRPVHVFAGAVHARKGLLVQEHGEPVAVGHLAQRLHHELVVIGRDVRLGEHRRKLELARSDLVMPRLGPYAERVQLKLDLFHEGEHAGRIEPK